ncbi:MAG: MarR family winged helix-turn-helix transcriptional regulator [Rhodoglobus sp.]
MAGPHTLAETERQVQDRVGGLPLDYSAMAVASNLFRAANAVRNHFERSVLSEHNLSWTAFVVLWVTWIWEPIETRQIALEGGFSKATLTGVLSTLERRGWLTRQRSTTDGRLVIVSLTAAGRELMVQLFPAFNVQEQAVTSPVDPARREELAEMLRLITVGVEVTS